MRIVLVFAALLLAAPLSATSGGSGPAEPRAPSTELASTSAPAALELAVAPAESRRTSSAEARRDQTWPQRGSFWWMVGVIVVAGVILMVVAD